MFGSILFRMVLWELAKIFLMSLTGITGILLMAGILAEATQHGLGPSQILAAIPLLIPSTLPYTIPATTLFAACVVYGRLAADNEILAIKAAGVNLFHVVKPGLVLGLGMSLCTMGLYYQLIPYTHHLLRAMVFTDAEELLYSMLRKQGMVSYPQLNYSMFVKGVQGRKLINPVFKRRAVNGSTDIVAQAKEAELRVNMAKRLVLIHMRFGVATSEDGSRAYFEDRIFDMPLPDDWKAEKNKRARALTWPELMERREEMREKLVEQDAVIEGVEQQIRSYPGKAPEEFVHHRQNHINQRKLLFSQFMDAQVEMIMRPALSLGCFFFVLVACPVGIWFGRSDFLSSFITCFLPIVIVYYPLTLCGTNMAKDGRLDPFALVWAANAVVGSVGVVIFAKLLRN